MRVNRKIQHVTGSLTSADWMKPIPVGGYKRAESLLVDNTRTSWHTIPFQNVWNTIGFVIHQR